MQVEGFERRGVLAIVALLFMVVVAAVLILSRPRSGAYQVHIFQDVPATTRLPHSTVSVSASRSIPTERTDTPPRLGLTASAAFALADEVRANRQAILDIGSTLREADVGADKLRSQIARQDDTIAAQRQALETGSATEAERSDGQTVLAAAIQTNEAARASLARYETTRSTLLERKASLQQRNTEIAARLKR